MTPSDEPFAGRETDGPPLGHAAEGATTPRRRRPSSAPRPARATTVDELRGRMAEAGQRIANLLRGEPTPCPSGRAPDLGFAEFPGPWQGLGPVDDDAHARGQGVAETGLLLGCEPERYRDHFESAPEAYLLADEFGTILEANRAAGALFNMPARELGGRPLASFAPHAERQHLRERLHAVAQGVGTHRWACTLCPAGRAPGAELEASISAAPDGHRGVRLFVRDVSERRARERRARALHADLEARVADQARELESSRRALEASRHALEALSAREREAARRAELTGRARDELLALIAGELRPALASLRARARRAREGADPAALRKALRGLERRARALVELVDEHARRA